MENKEQLNLNRWVAKYWKPYKKYFDDTFDVVEGALTGESKIEETALGKMLKGEREYKEFKKRYESRK